MDNWRNILLRLALPGVLADCTRRATCGMVNEAWDVVLDAAMAYHGQLTGETLNLCTRTGKVVQRGAATHATEGDSTAMRASN